MAGSQDAVLPFTHVVHRSRNFPSRRCPTCGMSSPRRSTGQRRLRDIGVHHPIVLEVCYSKHLCPACHVYFNCPMDDLAEPGGQYAARARKIAVDKVLVDHLPLESVRDQMFREFHVHVPPTTLHAWVAEAGKKDRSGPGPCALHRPAL